MDSVNNLSDTKTPGLAANILASLTASFASGNPVDGLFANFLSQIQTPPPPPPEPSTNTQTPSPSSASEQSQSPSQATGTSNTTNAPAPATSASTTNNPSPPHGWALIGKPQRHDAKSASDKSKPDDTANNQPAPSAPPPQISANSDPTGASNATPVVAAAAVTPSDPNTDTNASNNSANASGNNAPTNTAIPTPDLSQNTDTQTPAPPGDALPTVDISSSSNSSENTGGTTNNAAANSQLMPVLIQLEHLAAGRLANMTTIAPLNSATTTGMQNTSAAATPATTNDAQGKIDLKALLAELAGQNNAGVVDGGVTGQSGNTGTGGDTQNATTTSVAATTSLQNALPASGTSSAATTDKWMNASFLNLFNLAANSQNNASAPLIVNSAISSGIVTAGNDDADLNADTQGQGGANAHNAAAGIQTLDASLPPSAGSSQAASPYDFASQLSAMRAAKGGPTGLPTPVEQVMLQLSRTVTKDGSSQMTIQLRPAELGRVDVKLNIGSDGKVQGTVTADNPATLGLLLKDVRGLERALQEAGLRADSGSLQFNLRGDGQPGSTGGQTAGNQSGFANNAAPSSGSTTSLSAFADPTETYYLTPGGVNLRV